MSKRMSGCVGGFLSRQKPVTVPAKQKKFYSGAMTSPVISCHLGVLRYLPSICHLPFVNEARITAQRWGRWTILDGKCGRWQSPRWQSSRSQMPQVANYQRAIAAETISRMANFTDGKCCTIIATMSSSFSYRMYLCYFAQKAEECWTESFSKYEVCRH